MTKVSVISFSETQNFTSGKNDVLDFSFHLLVKRATLQGKLRSYAHELWDLLPAFCRCPPDTSQSFDSLAKLLVHTLKDDSSLHETISISLQVLVI